MDEISKNKLNKTNLKKESLKRIKLFNKINNFAKNNDIKPIFKINKNLIPMHFVGIAKNKKHACKIFEWGWKNEIEIVSWPSFDKNNKLNNKLIKKWEKYICIPLNQDIEKINDKKIRTNLL